MGVTKEKSGKLRVSGKVLIDLAGKIKGVTGYMQNVDVTTSPKIMLSYFFKLFWYNNIGIFIRV